MRYIQAVLLLLLVIISVTNGLPPLFLCEDGESSLINNCDFTGQYKNMDNFQIPENTAVGSTFYTLGAEDPDYANGGTVRYEILRYTGSLKEFQKNGYDYLTVNATSGEVSATQTIDYETVHLFRYWWRLTDSDGEILEQQYSTNVKNINDNNPEFSSSRYQTESIPENSLSSDDVIFTVSATDEDSLDGIKYTMIEEHQGWPCNGDIFQIDEQSGNITLRVNETLDFEVATLYTICVRVNDSGKPNPWVDSPLFDYAQVIVAVSDVQDTAPSFTLSNYDEEIAEDKPMGSAVITVQAKEGDRGVLEPNDILYSLSGGDGKFAIGNTTGTITIKEMLDRETSSSHTVGVKAQEVRLDGTYEQPPSSDFINITFQVSDVDDENATFSNSSIEIHLQEELSQESFVSLDGLNVLDKDQAPNNIITLSLGGPDKDIFKLQSSTIRGNGIVDVRVKNNSALDYEKKKSLDFEIYAGEGDVVQATALVHVILEDINDETPKFTKTEYVFDIIENSQGDVVGVINATDADSAPYNEIRYSLLGQGDDPQFEMNSTTGEIRTREDATLDNEGQSIYFFTCMASDGDRSATIIVQIRLTDDNDNTPEFTPSSENSVIVEEEKMYSERLLQVSASDRDKDKPNNVISFSLANSSMSDRFTIDEDTGDLYLSSKLDYEEDAPDEFDLTVIATDGGEKPLNGTATIHVTIQDVNDQSPVFSEDFYSGNVSEGASRKTTVLQVSARDNDDPGSVNSRIDYFFEDESVSDFRIDIKSGAITVNSNNLDRDEKGDYSLAVIAFDRGNPVLNGTCLVTINVLDVNNKPPTFNEEEPTAEIYENATSDDLVAMVNASDPDESAELMYSLEEVVAPDYNLAREQPFNSSGLFYVDASTGAVFTGDKHLDRESVSEYQLLIKVKDNKTATGTSTATVTLTVTVLDVNDNPPEFTESGVYRFTVNENTPVDSVISTSISATDADEGSNGEVRFELIDDVDFLLDIDPFDGVLTVNGTFDREKYATYNVTVLARDNGSPPLSSNRTIQIQINDINDNSPVFDSKRNNTAEVAEDFPNGTQILQVVAHDDDATAKFGTVSYDITGGNTLFDIDAKTGWIMIREGKELDRETEDTHILTISARDDEEGRQDTVQVTITVTDVNDNAPKFSKMEDTISIQESVEVGQLVTTVTATDRDEVDTVNSEVTYSISGGNEDGHFRINMADGVLRTNTSLSNRAGKYTLTILATDQGMPPKESEATLHIKVTDVNDDTPEIEYPKNLEDIKIFENYTGFVLNVKAKDTDSGDNGDLEFSFVKSVGEGGEDDEYFHIAKTNNDTAEITIKEKTDRETKPIYLLQVRVQDRGPSPLSATVSFTVSVTDADDNDPVFWTDPADRQTATFSVPENDDSATAGFLPEATDADEEINQHINYFIVDGNAGEEFVLDQNTSMLSVQKALDRELIPTHSLVVMVTSDADYSQSQPVPYDPADNTLLLVNISVADRNDNRPIFKEKLYTEGAKYNAEFDTEVAIIQATDDDIGNNARIVYKILSETYTNTDGEMVPGSITTFRVVNSTGSIRTLRNFDTEDAGYFTLEVQAEDSLNSKFTDKATVSIYLFNEDQQVEMTIFRSTDDVRNDLDEFESLIEEIIVKYGTLEPSPNNKRAAEEVIPVFVLDELQVLTRDNQPVVGWSVMKFHVVNKEDNTIIEPSVVVSAIDDAYEYAEIIRGDYGVTEIEIAVPPTLPPPTLDWVQWLLLGFLCALTVIVAGLVVTYCIMSSSYKRKLRAATAGVYESANPATKITNLAPNTNKYTEPGSNPVFGTKINEGYARDYDEVPEKTEIAETAEEKLAVRNGHAKQMLNDTGSEDQELVLEMYDDSADHEDVADEETGDRLIMQFLQHVTRERKGNAQVNLPDFSDLSITEI